ncbi:MAG: GH92 family glycosyl hydrolase [Bacteroidales bacterium]|nr:GH92 family glycosyl hydrolase [Bacteroidales bacterium]
MNQSFRSAILSVLLLTSAVIPAHSQQENLARYVNPFVGTGAVDGGSLAGNTFPGATCPFGMVQLSPDVEDFSVFHEGYEYGRDHIFGFSHTHQSGVGASDLQDILLMPSCRPLEQMYEAPDQSSRFNHERESASPGYYEVMLEDYGIHAELTATPRTGMHRYTFPAGKENNLMLDLVHGGVIHGYWQPGKNTELLDAEIKFTDPCTVVGYKISTGWERIRKVYFCIKFSRPVTDWYMWRDYVPGSWWMRSKNVYHKDPVVHGKRVKAFMQFADTGEPLVVKVGISTVSSAGAAGNIESDNAGWDFDGVRAKAEASWNKELSKIEIEGSEDQKRVFYTQMYHAFTQPNLFSDSDGQYTGPDHVVRTMPGGGSYYTTFSLWDTFRSAHPFYTIVQPSRDAAFVRSLLAFCDEYGYLPMITYWGTDIYCMIGNHSIPVLVDAALKGLPGVDPEKVFAAVKATSMREHESSPFADLDKYGYIPYETQAFSVASTLEISYNDACVAALAEVLGKDEDAAYFRKRSQNYRNLFDPGTLFFRAKDRSGNWREPFDPLAYGPNGDPYMEGNAWQYRFFVPHDMDGLISLMGGKKAFEEKLDSLFEWKSDDPNVVASIESSGRIGQYAHGNEPVHTFIYLYAYTDHPEKVRSYAHQVMQTQYLDTPAGYSGNEDCGQMSSWFLLSSLGFHPVDPASGMFALGAPLYRKAVIHLESGKTFTVLSEGKGKDGRKIKPVRLNGRKVQGNVISYQDIIAGGTLEF